MYKNSSKDFYKSLLETINTPNGSSFVLDKKEIKTLTFLLDDYNTFIQNIINDVDTFKLKLDQSKLLLREKIADTNRIINTKFENDKKKNSDYYDKQIKEVIDQTKKCRQEENSSIKKINDEILLQEQYLTNSLPLLDFALESNNKYYEKLLSDALKNYDEYLINVTNTTNELVTKLTSEHNKSDLMRQEKLNEKLAKNDRKIKEFQNDIVNLKLEFAQKEMNIKSKILVAARTLNDNINLSRNEKNKNVYDENIKYNIKISDIIRQQDEYLKKHNDKYKKTLDNFVNTTTDLNNQVHDIQVDYEKSVESYSRTNYYNYYSTLFELNNFLSVDHTNEQADTHSIRRANRKLYNLKLKSYYEKIDDLKNNYKEQMELLKHTYEIKLDKLNVERTLVESYKTYELDTTEIELQCQKQNLDTLRLFIDKQYESNTQIHNLNFDIKAKKANLHNEETILNFKTELQKTTLEYEIKIDELDKAIYALKNNSNYNIKKQALTTKYSQTVYEIKAKLEKIVSMLSLDKNNYVHDFNKYQSEYHKQVAALKALQDKRMTNEQINYFQSVKPAKINLIQADISAQINTLNYTKAKFIAERDYNLYKFLNNKKKKAKLNELTYNRKDFRFDCLYIYHVGDSFYQVINKCLILEDMIIATLAPKFDNSNYLVIAKKILKIFYSYIESMLDDFTSLEQQIIENRIDSITRNKYDNEVVKFTEENNLKIEKYQSLNKDLDNILLSYKNTLTLKTQNILNLKNELKKHKLFSNRYKFIVKEIKDEKRFIKYIYGQQKTILQNIKSNNDTIYKLKVKINDRKNQFEREKKFNYKSYYSLISKALKTKKLFINKLNQTYTSSNMLLNYDVRKESLNDLLKEYVTIFNKLFTIFKTTNEKDYNINYKKIIKLDLKEQNQLYKSTKKRNISRFKKYVKLKKKDRKNLNLSTNKLKHVDKKHEYNKILLEETFLEENRKLNTEFNKQTVLFHNNIKSITENISFLRLRSENKIKRLKSVYESDLKNLKIQHNDLEIKNDNKLKNSMKAKSIESSNLDNILNKSLLEISKDFQNQIDNLTLKKADIQNKQKIEKKQYQKKRLNIIADNNRKLLKARIKHNEEVKKIKLLAENNDLRKQNLKIITFFSKLLKKKNNTEDN